MTALSHITVRSANPFIAAAGEQSGRSLITTPPDRGDAKYPMCLVPILEGSVESCRASRQSIILICLPDVAGADGARESGRHRRAPKRRVERSSRRGRRAGGPPPTGTHSGRAPQSITTECPEHQRRQSTATTPEHAKNRHPDRMSVCGGARGIRTPDLLIANETRYQLRHSPKDGYTLAPSQTITQADRNQHAFAP